MNGEEENSMNNAPLPTLNALSQMKTPWNPKLFWIQTGLARPALPKAHLDVYFFNKNILFNTNLSFVIIILYKQYFLFFSFYLFFTKSY